MNDVAHSDLRQIRNRVVLNSFQFNWPILILESIVGRLFKIEEC